MYVDCFSGAAGDMLLGALLDAGLPLDALKAALGSLGVGHDIRVSRVVRCGVTATKFDVDDLEADGGHDHGTQAHTHTAEDGHAHGHDGHSHAHIHGHSHASEGHSHGHDGHRTLKEIAHLIGHSKLSKPAKARAVALFQRLGEAEAAIHGMSLDEVHLHEVGAVDSIIDIVGVVFAMEWFGIDDVEASALNVGGGSVDIAHGTFPVPAPATLRLLQGVPVYSAGPQVELVTPTGALLVTGYARRYGAMPRMAVDRIGYGAGTRDTPHTPNVVRVVIGERVAAVDEPLAGERAIKIECEIDDMNPQLFGPASDRLFEAGALDVFLTPIVMKKGRPGTLVTVLVREDDDRREAVMSVLFRETTTIGVRMERVVRETLERRWETVEMAGGAVRIKIATRGGVDVNAAPEFEDCVRVAAASGRPLKLVQAEALRAWVELRAG
jgi:uncharacterized protein (TIGR00299 family) protein